MIADIWVLIEAYPGLTTALGVLMASVWPVIDAWLRALKRHANQKWIDHGPDDNDEIKVKRVTDQVQADSMAMAMLPRSVVEKQVRKIKSSIPPPLL